jgi:pyruvate carboxylase
MQRYMNTRFQEDILICSQATALGLGDRFTEVKKMYAAVNSFGNLIKVTFKLKSCRWYGDIYGQ